MINKRKSTTTIVIIILIVILVLFFVFYFLNKNSTNLTEKQKTSILQDLSTGTKGPEVVPASDQKRIFKDLETPPVSGKVLSPEEKATLIKSINNQ